jgi:hypothetical protein
LAKNYEVYIGEYHNGPLWVLVPLGIWGAIGFLWFLVAGWRVLCNTFRYSEPGLKIVNTFLLSSFVARTLFFFAIYGAFYAELLIFTGVVGLSISLNGGARRKMSMKSSATVYVPDRAAETSSPALM